MTPKPDPLLDPQPARRRLPWRWIVIVLIALIVLGMPAGMLLKHEIADDPAFQLAEGEVPAGGSRAVAMAAALIHREVEVNGWVANDPWFMPGHWIDNMPNFQMGMMAAIARFSIELADQVGRARGTSQTDPDLREAAGLLQFPGDKWIIDLATSPWPQATSEEQYRRGRAKLLNYNKRLGDGQAIYERRGDNLMATVDRLALDLGSSSAVLEQRIEDFGGSVFDTRADDIFYSVKGQSYAYAMVLRELGRDFQGLLRERGIEALWANMIKSLDQAAAMNPAVVLNGSPDGTIFPNHLAAQGFYVLRARAQMREVTNVLLK